MHLLFKRVLLSRALWVPTGSLIAGWIGIFGMTACGDNNQENPPPAPANHCAPEHITVLVAGDRGTARVFSPDPLVRSGQANLSPNSSRLDEFATSVTLSHLGGHGVLEGTYVYVHNGTGCGEWFGAYDPGNQFSYPHSDSRFQEAMAYYWGDLYRTSLAQYGYLPASAPVEISAHCEQDDNAFFTRGKDANGQLVELVCLGDSVATPGASYADDATVTVHELEHATTTDNYSIAQSLNQFWYDEAGSLNEAVSDFMSLMFEQPQLSSSYDPRLFSRWALGNFIPNKVGTRGANKCPTYDPGYPECAGFPSFSGTSNTVSYIYPDGLGWPYANNFQGPGYARSAFANYKSQEEIHNAGVLLEGALWDVYDALRMNHGGDEAQGRMLATQLVLEAVRHLPKPTSTSLSPVTFRALADQMVIYGSLVGLNSTDQASVLTALTARGLQGGTPLTSSWASVGPGNAGVTPGIRIQDNPAILKDWLIRMTQNTSAGSLVPQGVTTGLNSQLDQGELVAIWFDIQNTAAQTAGGVQVTVTSLDPDITFDPDVNVAPLGIDNTQAQIRYGKVNGTAIVRALNNLNATYSVDTGNSYFRTNPFFDRSYTTALWVKVKPGAAHGKIVHFQVEALPSNGAASVSDFTATIN